MYRYVALVISTLALFSSFAVADCEQGERAGYVCGLSGPEDLVAVPATKWLVTSGLKQDDQPGRLFIIDREKKSANVLFSASLMETAHDAALFPDCPGPMDGPSFSAHGISLGNPKSAGYNLYVVNHGKREAIEVFQLDVGKKSPSLTWIGCVPIPEGNMANGVAAVPGGGIAATFFAAADYFDESPSTENKGPWISKLRDKEITGYAAVWSRGTGWQKVAGTEASGPNGIAISADGSLVWVANWAQNTITQTSLKGSGPRTVYQLGFMPDNLHWGDDGKLWVAGAVGTPDGYFDCWATPGCKSGYAVASIDPVSGEVSMVPHPDTSGEFGEATAALMVGGEIWVGANPSDRILYFSPTN